MQIVEEQHIRADVPTRAQQYWLLFIRFLRRYGGALLTLAASAVVGWNVASGVSNYTQGGWELHIVQSAVGIDLHFHHWYFGIPLYILAFLMLVAGWNALLSIFIFGLGETLAAHSYINEGGIPSIFENGPTMPLPPEVYFPAATAFALLYAFFIVRREEWLARAREREEIAMSYLYPRAQNDIVLARLSGWASKYMQDMRRQRDQDTNIEYGEWHSLDRATNSEWELHYTASPFDDQLNLLVVRLEHIPLEGRAGQLDDWMSELDGLLKPLVRPAVEGPVAARTALSTPRPNAAEIQSK